MGPGGGHHLRRLHEDNGVELRLGQRSGPLNADTILVAVGVAARLERPTPRPTSSTPATSPAAPTGKPPWSEARTPPAACSASQPKPEQPPLVWSDQYGVRIQRVGEITDVEPSDDLTYRRHGRLKAVVLMNRPEAVRQARRDLKEAA